MDKNHVTEQLPEYLDGILEETQQKKIEVHLKNCPSCTKELEELKTLFKAIEKDKVDVPSERMRTNFLEQLALEKQSMPEEVAMDPKHRSSKKSWFNNLLKLAASIVLLISSFLLGRYQQEERSNSEIAALEDETLQARQMAMLSLMESKSASRRIQGVHYIDKFADPDDAIIKALTDRMLQDENTNVRLTAVEALRNFTASDTVKIAFITALKTEKDPSIQITIIHTLVSIQEKKAIVPMQRLLQQEETQSFVKKQIELVLPSLI